MATCPACRMTFAYSEPHVCDGRDYTKVWLMLSVAAGALVGGASGLWYGVSVIGQACKKPDAGNLCGMVPSYFVPGHGLIGAVVGAFVAPVGVVLYISRQRA